MKSKPLFAVSSLLAASIILFFVLSISSLASAQQTQSNISRGSSLTPTKTSSWLSKSGLYAFGFYQRGNGYSVGVTLAGIPKKTVVWTANRDVPPVSGNATLLLTDTDGRLILQTAQDQDTYIADIQQTASYASMLDKGNFVLYNSDGGIIWQSFTHPTFTLLPTQILPAPNDLSSSLFETDQSTGIFFLRMQRDRNLVLYPIGNPVPEYSYWQSETYDMGDKGSLNLDLDGRLYILNATGFTSKNLTSRVFRRRGTIFMLKIDWDGLLRLYSHDLSNSSRWSILCNNTNDGCAPRGLCGFNMFCVSSDQKPGCRCLPGFAEVNQGNRTSGCERNFAAES
ncbi:hypothetical protein EZV62_014921 [Acer yangbiense]|uniref:Bulb-type lectin domain-containing protein n=1 Tax=Acer yangbiense TaxID=1000413 RepID=A0A5C7GPL6_9ROSI|nr:hypothetical protein EZV62_028061 [Acer yangbiense]TXG60348.1 hypothetical protein EZV62_014921 [Acer yangbiense]